MQIEKSLHRDQRGATMVIGIFMAMFVIGVFYYVWGMAEAIVYRQIMQDAADSAAFGGAVIKARGMNLLSLLNVVVAAAAAAETTVRSMLSGLQIATTLAALFCIITWGSTGCDEAGTHGEEAADMRDVLDDVEPDMEDLADVVNLASEAIITIFPGLAAVKAQEYVSIYSPPVTYGLLLPAIEDLPVEDDDSKWPCKKKVAPYARKMAPVGMLICCEMDFYLGVGMGGAAGMAKVHAKRWCGEEYFYQVLEDAEMGDDNFQVRSYMKGNYSFETRQEGVSIANWGRTSGAAAVDGSMKELAKWSFAQAEFYFDDDMDEREWLWHMMWRARLRRFRLPSSGAGIPIPNLSEVADVVVH